MSARPAVAVIDYGMGNLRSVEKALLHCGAEASIVDDPLALGRFDALVLPGVGAFPKAMERIRAGGIESVLRESAEQGVPILGICLGLQLLFESSEEHGGADGLGLLAGHVVRIDAPGRKVPHIGWAEVDWKRDSVLGSAGSTESFYFVHSYAPVPEAPIALGTARYGTEFVCAAGEGKVMGVQFHPEKSGRAGLALLKGFLDSVGRDRGEGGQR